jgi:SAM-dependent methyltransferase
MILSDIIAYKNLLDASTPLEAVPLAHNKLRPMLNLVKGNEIQVPGLADQLEKEYGYILQTLKDFESTIEKIKNSLQSIVDQNNPIYYELSTKNYKEIIGNESPEHILERKLPIYNEVVDQLKARLRFYNTWQHPAMIIRPGHELWIEELVGFDPLYLLDHSNELIEPAILRFNDQYQRRLRNYVISDTEDIPIFDSLPENQFGFCLIYNFFNYKPIEIIEKYLRELFTKLRPGGVIALTFNDCDRAEGTKLFESGFMSYTPASQIYARCYAIGYKIENIFRTDQSCTWLEIKRPGEITSLRGGQTLAKILYKDVDHLYTEEQIKNI